MPAGGINWQLTRYFDGTETDIERQTKRKHYLVSIQSLVGPVLPSPGSSVNGTTSGSVVWTVGNRFQMWALSNGNVFLCTADGWMPASKPTSFVIRDQTWEYWGDEESLT